MTIDNVDKIVHNTDKLNNMISNTIITGIEKKIDHKLIGFDPKDFEYFTKTIETQT